MVDPAAIRARLIRDVFDRPLIDNALRGYWCEYMLAEALGPACRHVGGGWHAWDLEIGSGRAGDPLIRIQVKNAARLQTWHSGGAMRSDPAFVLTWRRRPAYFERDWAGVSCEAEGFLCDVYLLCLHDETDEAVADHRDPAQWQVFVLPVSGPASGVTEAERAWAVEKSRRTGRPVTLIRKPRTMAAGIRGRTPIPAVRVSELSVDLLRDRVAPRAR